jgi:mono/diheme cytochrome c family protein
MQAMHRHWLSAVALLLATASAAADDSVHALYATHCAACHGADRFGGIGPALLPENLGRLSKREATAVIAGGRIATQMPSFAAALDAPSIDALVSYIYRGPVTPPRWDETEIRASHSVVNPAESLPLKPVHGADLLNLFTVVEAGDHHVTILDGDRFMPLARFKSRFALHGGAKYSPDGRFVYLASRDGWVSKYDLWSLSLVAEIRAGINTRNIAVSSDGQWVIAGNFLPHSIVILRARDLTLFRVVPAADAKGNSSRVSAVYDAGPRRSFIVAFKDIKELWEMSYDPNAEPVYSGLVHSHEKGAVEGIAEKQPFARRRVALEDYFDDFFFSPNFDFVVGASRTGTAAVYNLDVRRKIADLPLEGLPHLGSGISWLRKGRRVMATPHLKEGKVSIIDMREWSVVREIKTAGPGFFMRSHENTRYAWVDAFSSPRRDTIQLIDKETLEIERELRPEPGKTAAHVEFTRDGRYALVSIWDMEGALVVYDTRTLAEVKRIPMVKPVGKYNVYNKIHLSEGTSR